MEDSSDEMVDHASRYGTWAAVIIVALWKFIATGWKHFRKGSTLTTIGISSTPSAEVRLAARVTDLEKVAQDNREILIDHTERLKIIDEEARESRRLTFDMHNENRQDLRQLARNIQVLTEHVIGQQKRDAE